ncbi:lasso peptide biosynthesis B2 protein [Brucella pituitosa]|uniref:lasso peptide biosynthesis B2 protein n=1 Tax=Brucella pituitosa TaxID=571256 RepID=UPI0009A1D8AD|nr:lasso peptide biosynthesis B2 protein [Brucella pituitosa]
MVALKQGCFVVFAKEGGVIFDSRDDRFLLLSPHQTELLQRAFMSKTIDPTIAPEVQRLLEVYGCQNGPTVSSTIVSGFHDYIWCPRLTGKPKNPKLRFICWVYMIQLSLKWRGITRTVGYIARSRAVLMKFFPDCSFESAANEIMTASKFSPFRFKCLEFATALRCFAEIKQIKNVKLCIGVQRFPFLSHAWVEHAGAPINDECSLSERAAVIFEL